MKRLKVLLRDLNCASCVPKIEQVMRQQEGVIWATVNFAAGEAMIIYDPAGFSPSRLVRAVDQLGYQVSFGDEPVRLAHTKPGKTKLLAWMRQRVRTFSR